MKTRSPKCPNQDPCTIKKVSKFHNNIMTCTVTHVSHRKNVSENHISHKMRCFFKLIQFIVDGHYCDSGEDGFSPCTSKLDDSKHM